MTNKSSTDNKAELIFISLIKDNWESAEALSKYIEYWDSIAKMEPKCEEFSHYPSIIEGIKSWHPDKVERATKNMPESAIKYIDSPNDNSLSSLTIMLIIKHITDSVGLDYHWIFNKHPLTNIISLPSSDIPLLFDLIATRAIFISKHLLIEQKSILQLNELLDNHKSHHLLNKYTDHVHITDTSNNISWEPRFPWHMWDESENNLYELMQKVGKKHLAAALKIAPQQVTNAVLRRTSDKDELFIRSSIETLPEISSYALQKLYHNVLHAYDFITRFAGMVKA